MSNLFKGFIAVCMFVLVGFNLQAQEKNSFKKFTQVEVQPVYKDSVSIRALHASENELFFASSGGKFGHMQIEKNRKLRDGRTIDELFKIIASEVIEEEGANPEFRSVAGTDDAFFFLSVDNPALLYRYGKNNLKLEKVYTENTEGVFYDSMAFWNNDEGIAMGDPTDGCLSILITRNGGKNWKKLPCSQLPKTADGEAAFAASNSNIAIQGDQVWIISGGKKSRVFHSGDKGAKWKVHDTPIVQGKQTTGAYSVDFYDSKNGFIIGGDYTNPSNNNANKAITTNGGKTWKLVADGSDPGYKSSVKYVPNSGGNGLVAVGESGISYSPDGGNTWKQLSSEGFHSIEFINPTTAFAAGNGKISKLIFK